MSSVHPGAFCSQPGQEGVFSAGTPAMCTQPDLTKRPRWRRNPGAPPGRRRAPSSAKATAITARPEMPFVPLDVLIQAVTPPAVQDQLGEQDKQILALEKDTFRSGAAKVAAIRDQLGMSEIRYFQALNALLDRPAAMAEEPILIRLLRQARGRRRR